MLLPLLAVVLIILPAMISANDWDSDAFRWYGSSLVILWVCSLPAILAYVVLAAKLNLRRGVRSAAVSAALGAVLAVVLIVLGGGFKGWGLTLEEAAYAAVTMAALSACLPKREAAAD